jgi:hypothetical protein
MLPRSIRNLRRVVGSVLGAAAVWLALECPTQAQNASVHWQHSSGLPPGAIGDRRLGSGGPLSGYFQPIAIEAPTGATIEFADAGGFAAPQPSAALVGMLVAPVYRLKITHIPGHEGREIFPTVEVIDRLYPPAGQEARFPIPVTITLADLELALSGRYVTRIVYLEDPETALPIAQQVGEENWFEVQPGRDLLAVADHLGRPVAILRIGGRTPSSDGPDASFLYGSPPLVVYDSPPGPLAAQSAQPLARPAPEPGAASPKERTEIADEVEYPTTLVNPAAHSARILQPTH